jgi:hypothetical protein
MIMNAPVSTTDSQKSIPTSASIRTPAPTICAIR